MLKIRIILDLDGLFCGWCTKPIYHVSHLFVTCRVSASLWHRIFRLLGMAMVSLGDLISLFEVFSPLGGLSRIIWGMD